MTRLGVVMTQAVVHHYRRDELLRRLANPFWFQSFGAFPKSRTPPAGDASRGGAQLARGRAEIRGQPHAKQFALPSSAISDYRAFHCAKAKAPSGDGFRRRSSDCPAALPEKPKGLWVELAVDPQREMTWCELGKTSTAFIVPLTIGVPEIVVGVNGTTGANVIDAQAEGWLGHNPSVADQDGGYLRLPTLAQLHHGRPSSSSMALK
jgi:hypothetical protein